MAGHEPAGADLGVRRRRIVFRAWHRGTREMDLVLGRFADAHSATLSAAEIELFEALMEAPDTDSFRWITGSLPTPANYDTPLLHRIRAFHTATGPLHG
jgi:antitoxin CptB